MTYRTRNNRGFTIVELMIAVAVFSFVIAGASAVVLQVIRMYYKGVVTTRTQDTARNVIEGISRPIQLAGSSITQAVTFTPTPLLEVEDSVTPGVIKVQCIGNKRYTWVEKMVVDKTVTSNKGRIRHALWRDTVANPSRCSEDPPDLTADRPSLGGESLVPDNTRIVKLSIEETDPNTDLWDINLHLVYGDIDLIDTGANYNCKGQFAGSQWCASVILNTKVFKRVV